MSRWLLSFVLTVLFIQSCKGVDILICAGASLEIVCNNSNIIEINRVHYGRFLGVLCIGESILSERCNASIEAQKMVESNCHNKTTCLVQFDKENPLGECNEDTEPYAEVIYNCIANNSLQEFLEDTNLSDGAIEITAILYSLLGIAFLAVVITGSICFIRLRFERRGSEPTTTNNSMSPQTEATRSETAANIYDVENQYDEISINEEIPRKQEEYHHLEFIPSKTSNHPAYDYTKDATYDHAVVDYKPIRNTEYDSSQSIDAYTNIAIGQNNT